MKANVFDQIRVPAVPLLNEPGKPAFRTPNPQAAKKSGAWRLPAALLLLSAIPLLAGAVRLAQLAVGVQITPENARFFAMPLPVVVHILSAALFTILGAFQFTAGFRRRWPGWHRATGKLVVVCGLLVALSGLWMTLFYARPANSGVLLFAFRLLFGSAMLVSIILGFAAIRRGKVSRHRAWMLRAYAIGLGAGTQAFTLGFGPLIFGPPTELSVALLMGAGWVINLAVAEWAIRRPLAAARQHANAHL